MRWLRSASRQASPMAFARSSACWIDAFAEGAATWFELTARESIGAWGDAAGEVAGLEEDIAGPPPPKIRRPGTTFCLVLNLLWGDRCPRAGIDAPPGHGAAGGKSRASAAFINLSRLEERVMELCALLAGDPHEAPPTVLLPGRRVAKFSGGTRIGRAELELHPPVGTIENSSLRALSAADRNFPGNRVLKLGGGDGKTSTEARNGPKRLAVCPAVDRPVAESVASLCWLMCCCESVRTLTSHMIASVL
mmetsp:Transcript_71192/g.170500  ORF Transcript_71192/g.170500 Transcript_71192/m.170500 type:complete len:250 (-) Transcript_71192:110-859(-)